ncbi:hypothetical protein IC762_23820 [Bradyrhizobium genosp. L]|uniref:hypothetical protein n=1 Tax=Bradyrhizobium genosp. L TaxID=83637 RepID=UPI0018A2C5BE|nr:hypothetical protein [Bradyrhizobium genosp. L]QPF82757.1 hypothetical protein IC762_23820 [Bradyrhizobium genosp. L]
MSVGLEGGFRNRVLAADPRIDLRMRATAPLPAPGEDWTVGTHFVEIPTLPDMRRLLGPADAAMRRARSQAFYGGAHDRARARLGLGMHDRGEEYVFADGQIHARDFLGQARHLPAHVKAVRLPSMRIESGQTWDLSVRHTAWKDVGAREELYVYVHVDRLTVAPGARIEIHGNVFILVCDEIVLHDGEAGRGPHGHDGLDIRILSTPHAAFSRFRAAPARPGLPGADGASGAGSRATAVVGTPFGPCLQEFSPDRDGEAGRDGGDGSDGTAGENGGMTMLADVRIGALTGFGPEQLRIFAQAGAGFPGGDGGQGGKGGDGGSGADGVDGIEGLSRGGHGGRGGDGGRGGSGGRGGNGGLASNIFIELPAAHRACLELCSKDSEGGAGGAAGPAGAGGHGGAHGACARPDAPVLDGKPGRCGSAGAPGKPRSGPKMHVFTVP